MLFYDLGSQTNYNKGIEQKNTKRRKSQKSEQTKRRKKLIYTKLTIFLEIPGIHFREQSE